MGRRKVLADLASLSRLKDGPSWVKYRHTLRLLGPFPYTAQLHLIPWDHSTMQTLLQRYCPCGWYSWTTNRSPELWSSSSTGSCHGDQYTLCPVQHGNSCRLTTVYHCCALPLHGELHLALIVKHADIPSFTSEHQSEFSWNPSTPPFHSIAFCRNSALAM